MLRPELTARDLDKEFDSSLASYPVHSYPKSER